MSVWLVLIGFLVGVAVTLIAVIAYVCRDELRRFRSIWRDEPDEHLRPYFVFVRRVLRGEQSVRNQPAPRSGT